MNIANTDNINKITKYNNPFAPIKTPGKPPRTFMYCTNKGVTAVANCSQNSDYIPDSKDDKNGSIEFSRQRSTGDCWLLSGINSLSYSQEGRAIINEALEYQNGQTIVHLKGYGDVTITDAQLASVRKQPDEKTSQYSMGDDDMLIFELAIEEVIDDFACGNLTYDIDYQLLFPSVEKTPTTINNSSTDSGTPGFLYYLLTGKTSKNSIYSEAEKTLKEMENNDNIVATAAGINGLFSAVPEAFTLKDAQGKKLTLPRDHGYAIKEVGENVTMVNPWDSSIDLVIPKETFLDYFYISACDLSDDNQEVDLIQEIDSIELKKETINGQKYEVKYSKDEEERLIFKEYGLENGEFGVKIRYDENEKEIEAYIGSYNENGFLKKEEELYTGDINRIFERNLLNINNSYTSEDLAWLCKISDEDWDKTDFFINNPNMQKNIAGREMYLISNCTNYDIDCIKEIITNNPNADIKTLTDVLDNNFSYALEQENPEKYFKNLEKKLGNHQLCTDKTLFIFGRTNCKKLVNTLQKIKNEYGEAGLDIVADRNLLYNPFIPQKLSADDIYTLSVIPNENWNKAMELMQNNPEKSIQELFG